jgi:hypothetical protein
MANEPSHILKWAEIKIPAVNKSGRAFVYIIKFFKSAMV